MNGATAFDVRFALCAALGSSWEAPALFAADCANLRPNVFARLLCQHMSPQQQKAPQLGGEFDFACPGATDFADWADAGPTARSASARITI